MKLYQELKLANLGGGVGGKRGGGGGGVVMASKGGGGFTCCVPGCYTNSGRNKDLSF